MTEYSKSRVKVRDLEVHDTVLIAGPETTESDSIYSLDFLGESDTLHGEVLEACESEQPGKIKMKVRTPNFFYLLEVDRSQEFLTISPNILTAAKIQKGHMMILRGEVAPNLLDGRISRTHLVKSHGATVKVVKVKTLSDGCLKFTVLLSHKRFRFVVEPKRMIEVI